MLENYFLQLPPKDCRQSTPHDGFRFPLPSSGEYGNLGIKEVQTIVMEQNLRYPPTTNAIFLPYVENNINLCIQSDKDVLSAPFSGCHMVRFYYTGDCLFEKINKSCKDQKFGCQTTCKYRYKTIVGHIAYETRAKYTCEGIWENNIKPYCNNVIDFAPFSFEAITWINSNREARVHGLITKDGRKFSIGIDCNDKIVFIYEM